MKKLVFFPSDPISVYIEKGRTYNFLDEYFNPGGYFDEVYCLSPWGDKKEETIGKIHYIKSSPYNFKRKIRILNPDVVRAYGGYCCADWASYSKVRDIPTVVSVHDTNPELIHSSLAYADGIICMSQAVKDAVLRLVPNVTSNIWVMPNRIDTSIYKRTINNEVMDELNKRFPGNKHILHVGRKAEQKNLDTVIRAMKLLDDGIVTVFVGQGDVKKYQKLAEAEGVSERCYWVDRVSSYELPLWYSWCDCMCTPSRWEGFGYVFIEAAACEAAIITSNIGPMNEYLKNGENAILVDDYENPESIADAIKYVLEGSDEVEKIKHNARDVGEKFEKDVIDREEISIYKEMSSINPRYRNNNELKKYMMKRDCIKKCKAIVYSIAKVFGLDIVYHKIKMKKD